MDVLENDGAIELPEIEATKKTLLSDSVFKEEKFVLYKKRWVILFLFVLLCTTSAFQWIQYCIIANVIMKYYGVGALAVDWTSLISMILYPVLLMPATYIMDRMDLRAVVLLGTLGTCVGTCIKLLSVDPDLFWVTFLGQTIVSAAMLFILSLPPRLASIWFGAHEVSTACSIGVFGTQLGSAIGFLVPPMIVQDSDDVNEVAQGLNLMFRSVAWYTAVVSLLVILIFQAEPITPPSASQAELRKIKLVPTNTPYKAFIKSYKSLLSNKAFNLLAISYGMNVGVFASVSTILNQLILNAFAHSQEFAGRVGLLIVLIGMIGSITFGYILDKTKSYKATTVFIYALTTAGMIFFTISLQHNSIVLVYLSAGSLGFFLNAYYLVGFELAVELTYPEPESSSAGVLTAAAQTCGIAFTYAMHYMMEVWGGRQWLPLGAMVAVLAVGTVITWTIPNELRRQMANRREGVTEVVMLSQDIYEGAHIDQEHVDRKNLLP